MSTAVVMAIVLLNISPPEARYGIYQTIFPTLKAEMADIWSFSGKANDFYQSIQKNESFYCESLKTSFTIDYGNCTLTKLNLQCKCIIQ